MVRKILIYLLSYMMAYSYINIHPLTFDGRIDGVGEMQEYTLYNGTDKPVRYEIYVEESQEKRSMANWIEYYPKTIFLPPGMEGVIKIFIQSPKKTQVGEYSAFVGIKELYVPNIESMKKGGNELNILTNFKFEISGYVGNLETDIEIMDLNITHKNSNMKVKGKARNTGKRRGTFSFYLSDSRDKEFLFLGERRLLVEEDLNLSEFSQEIRDPRLKKNFDKYKKLIIKEKNSSKAIKTILLN